MPATLKRNSVVVAALAAFFYWAFMFAKHSPALRDVIPFGDDPYDAVGSFGIIAGVLLALVSLVRAFRRYHECPSTEQSLYLIRCQAAVPLLVLITAACDVIALARHPARWMDAPSRAELILLIAAMALAGASVLALIRASRANPVTRSWRSAIIWPFAAALVLMFYPERLIEGFATHLLTVIMGDLILFAPMRPLLLAIIPGAEPKEPAPGRFRGARFRWSVVMIIAILFGVFAFVGEMSEGGGAMPLRRVMLVASVFLGLAITGLLISYGLLARPLGLAGGRS